jgi:hypothetical protein
MNSQESNGGCPFAATLILTGITGDFDFGD